MKPPPRPSAPAPGPQQLYADGKNAEIGAPGKGLPKDEAGNFIASQEKSDVVHDLLAFLAERMLEMNKEKQKEIKGFLGWLESYLGAKVEDLTPAGTPATRTRSRSTTRAVTERAFRSPPPTCERGPLLLDWVLRSILAVEDEIYQKMAISQAS
jgi:hypothetical protein